MGNPEHAVVLNKTDLEQEFAGFWDAATTASRVVIGNVCPFRPNAANFNPPILFCDGEQYEQLLEAVKGASHFERNDMRGPFMTDILRGVVYCSKEGVKQRLQEPYGSQRVTRSLAEEILHAVTTFGGRNGTRIGFVHVPDQLQPHRLAPGKIYDSSGIRYLKGKKKPEAWDDTRRLRELRLTEAVTDLAVRSMILKLVTVDPKYGKYLLFQAGDRMPLAIDNTKDVSRAAIFALVSGNERALTIPYGEVLLEMLKIPHLDILNAASITDGKTPSDILPF
jgi:hypothetical protein